MGAHSTVSVTRRDAINALRIADYGRLPNELLAQLLYVLVGDVPVHNFDVSDTPQQGEYKIPEVGLRDLTGWLDTLYEKENDT